jgi:hypothetical protein
MPGRTLEQLEGQTWPEPDFNSQLVETCHRLRTKPLDDFTVEDLRIMIGQKIGLLHLLPLAIKILKDDPLAEGDCYPGDLLTSVIRAESSLASSPDLLRFVLDLADQAMARLVDDDDTVRRELADFITRNGPAEPQLP